MHPLADDPDRVVAYYASTGSLMDGSPYENTYLSLVTVPRLPQFVVTRDVELRG